MTTKEKELINDYVEMVGQGNMEALEELYKLIYNPLYTILKRIYKNHHDIEDAIDKTVELLIQKSSKLLNYKHCFAWIIKSATNFLKNHYRKEANRNKILMSIPLKTHVKFSESSVFLTMQIKDLSESDKFLIYYRFCCKLTVKQISVLCCKSVSTINREIKVLLKNLKEKVV